MSWKCEDVLATKGHEGILRVIQLCEYLDSGGVYTTQHSL